MTSPALDAPQPLELVAQRFGKSIEWARLHIGDHRCLDDRRYVVSCLVTDSTCDRAARGYLRLIETRRGEDA